jgi:hypothetical protein
VVAREEPRYEPAPRPAPAPRIEEPRIEPRIEPKKLLEDAGLVMIETDRAKAPSQPAVAEEPLHLGRPRRERPVVQTQEEELKQVETKR